MPPKGKKKEVEPEPKPVPKWNENLVPLTSLKSWILEINKEDLFMDEKDDFITIYESWITYLTKKFQSCLNDDRMDFHSSALLDGKRLSTLYEELKWECLLADPPVSSETEGEEVIEEELSEFELDSEPLILDNFITKFIYLLDMVTSNDFQFFLTKTLLDPKSMPDKLALTSDYALIFPVRYSSLIGKKIVEPKVKTKFAGKQKHAQLVAEISDEAQGPNVIQPASMAFEINDRFFEDIKKSIQEDEDKLKIPEPEVLESERIVKKETHKKKK